MAISSSIVGKCQEDLLWDLWLCLWGPNMLLVSECGVSSGVLGLVPCVFVWLLGCCILGFVPLCCLEACLLVFVVWPTLCEGCDECVLCVFESEGLVPCMFFGLFGFCVLGFVPLFCLEAWFLCSLSVLGLDPCVFVWLLCWCVSGFVPLCLEAWFLALFTV